MVEGKEEAPAMTTEKRRGRPRKRPADEETADKENSTPGGDKSVAQTSVATAPSKRQILIVINR